MAQAVKGDYVCREIMATYSLSVSICAVCCKIETSAEVVEPVGLNAYWSSKVLLFQSGEDRSHGYRAKVSGGCWWFYFGHRVYDCSLPLLWDDI